ncbi:MAG TPA: malto-oligosyltrehalose trehalohydrolase [Pseudomonas xinjiangensis]|uniref:Malto-oligosyltrehalose trehalohydrolase n=2 Tax=root TaxID=1 RepID=A0A7V1FR61_9GAMM|nr:malto-oligosyltrehalose trehalohydrolase [Halopseudomonas xinjiangensis]HEC46901.1 malto-oligosyltrehalose trehalohydrolase [Halopseudomonas xinjiangensis]
MPTRPTHGAFLDENGHTHFSLWAPDAHQVSIELDDGNSHTLQARPDGWFATEFPCKAGTGYRFLINGDSKVPDPASRAQIGDVHGFSSVVDHRAYHWTTDTWQGRPWHETVIYELHVGLLGGFKGVQAYLPYLKKLGVTAVELMPLGEFPGSRNWGYDGVLPFAPEASYGSPEDLKDLVDTAHSLSLMVYVDVVYNHFGPDGNYLGQYASDFFRTDIQTPWGPSIDFRRTEVRDYFCENALMWIMDYRIDGLRLDAVHAISEKDFLVELAQRVRQAAGPERHVHLVLENEDNAANLLQRGFDAQWNDDGHNVLHALLTGEEEGYYADFASDSTVKMARCMSEGFIYQGQATRHGHARGEPSAHLPPSSFVLFLQNHDQIGNRAFGERLITLADEDALKASIALMLLSPMVPLLFMGEEWGSRKPFLFFTDHNEELAQAVREGRQNEFKEFSLFASHPERTVPDPNSIDTFSASRPDYSAIGTEQHQPWQDFYSHLLTLRHDKIIPRLADTQFAGVKVLADSAVSAAWTLSDQSVLRIDINLSEAFVTCEPASDTAEVLFFYRAEPGTDMLAPRSMVAVLENPA